MTKTVKAKTCSTSSAPKKETKCCICGGVIHGYGNNPYPLSPNEDDECCDRCNYYVVQARIVLSQIYHAAQDAGKAAID